MSYWKRLVVDGADVDLAHLEPFEFQALPKGFSWPVSIRVVFNNHCFSEEFDTKRHTEPLPKSHVPAHEIRAFDSLRYELSKALPDLLRSLPDRRIAQTRTGPLVRIELAGGGEYGIFFLLNRKGETRCELFVMSAYPLERPKQHFVATGEMKFTVALAKVMQGQKPKFPPGRF